MKSNDELNNDTISVIENLVFVYENLNILNNESIREHLDFAIKSIKNMEKEFAELKQADEANEFPSVGDTVWYIEGRYYMRTPSNMKPRKIIVTEISKKNCAWETTDCIHSKWNALHHFEYRKNSLSHARSSRGSASGNGGAGMTRKTKTALKIIGTALLALMVLTLIARGAG